jgi:hypothetical protein
MVAFSPMELRTQPATCAQRFRSEIHTLEESSRNCVSTGRKSERSQSYIILVQRLYFSILPLLGIRRASFLVLIFQGCQNGMVQAIPINLNACLGAVELLGVNLDFFFRTLAVRVGKGVSGLLGHFNRALKIGPISSVYFRPSVLLSILLKARVLFTYGYSWRMFPCPG